MTFGEEVMLQRKRTGLSQTELAERVGISRNYVSLIERGRLETVTLGVLMRLCDVLDIPREHLISTLTSG